MENYNIGFHKMESSLSIKFDRGVIAVMLIIDRFEGNYAVVELNRDQMVNIPRAILPQEAEEGDVITVEIDHNQTEERKNKVKELTRELWDE